MIQDTHISLAHGNGGRLMRELIENLFAQYLKHPKLDIQTDAAVLDWQANNIIISTDGFTVQPLEFPHSNIGALAVHGTCNDLAVSRNSPLFDIKCFY